LDPRCESDPDFINDQRFCDQDLLSYDIFKVLN